MKKRVRILMASGVVALAALAWMQSPHGPGSADRGLEIDLNESPLRGLVTLKKRAGNVSCWLNLRLKPGGSISYVVLGHDHPLQVTRDGSSWSVSDRQLGSSRDPAFFNWYAGASIVIHGENLSVDAWEVNRSDGPADSSRRQGWRTFWLVAYIGLGLVGVSGTVAQIIWPESQSRAPSLTADYCVELMVDELEAPRAEDTRRMRQLLLRSFQTKKLDLEPREMGFFNSGVDQLAERIDTLIEGLRAKRARLG